MQFSSDIIQRIIDMPQVVWWSVGVAALILWVSWLIYEMQNPVDLRDDIKY